MKEEEGGFGQGWGRLGLGTFGKERKSSCIQRAAYNLPPSLPLQFLPRRLSPLFFSFLFFSGRLAAHLRLLLPKAEPDIAVAYRLCLSTPTVVSTATKILRTPKLLHGAGHRIEIQS